MSYAPPKKLDKDPEIRRLSVKDWINGTVTASVPSNTPLRGLKRSGNVFLERDAAIRPRPSKVRYGPQPTGKVLGEIYEFKKVTGTTTENWMICMQSFSVSASPSASRSPSSSASASASASLSPSASTSQSRSRSPSASASPSASVSLSASPSASASPSSSTSLSPSSSVSPSSSASASRSPSSSASASRSPSSSVSPSSSASLSRSPSSSASPSASVSISPSSSASPSSSVSASPSAPVTGFAQIFIARGEDATWTACSGKLFDEDALAHFFQIGNKVVIMNGSDTLSYLNITNSAVVPFTALTTPAAPTLNTDGVGGSGYNITYRISDNSTVGETAASNALTVEVDTDREFWNPPSAGGTDQVTIDLPSAGVGVQSRNIYMGTVSGSEYLIAAGIPATATTFIDDGSHVQDFTRLYPTTNSTAGPRVSRGANIDGRAFLVGDADNPYYVWNGGDPGFELDFSPANGGGFTLVGNGSKDVPSRVILHRIGQGQAAIKVLCKGTNGKGKRFTMTADSLTIGSTVIPFYAVAEDDGADGTDSPDAVVSYNNDIHYPSRDGFKKTGTLPQIQNVLSTTRVSATIQDSMASLNQSAMERAVALAFEGRIYNCLPVNSDSNNEIWVLDLDSKGAWMKPWSIACDWMWLYDDNTGNTNHLILSDNGIYSLTYAALTTDDGVAFSTYGQSGEVYFSEDKRMWVQLLAVVVMMSDAQGNTSWQITGKTEDSNLQAIGEPTVFIPTKSTTVAGWGEVNKYIAGWGRNAWSKVNQVPTTAGASTQDHIIEVDEEVQWASYAWNSVGPGVDYQITDIIFEYIEVGIKDLQ